MKHFRNNILLFTFCICSLIRLPYRAIWVSIIFSGLIFCGLNYYLDHDSFRAAGLILYAILSLFFSDYLVLAPLFVYSGMALLKKHGRLCLSMPAAAIVFILFLHRTGEQEPALFLSLAGCVVSAVLYRDAVQFDSLWSVYTSSRDDTTRRNLLLSEHNKNLMEKQDYEIYAATLKERNRIAREIHDNVGHLLSRSILVTGAIRTISSEPSLTASIISLEETLHQAMNSIRESVHDMHDDSIDLKDASRQLLSSFTFCPAVLSYDMGNDIPVPVKYCFLSVLKESLSNMIRHSNATQASVTMREHPGLYQLCIEDNGTLLNETVSISDTDTGIGLANMRERVRKLNGHFTTQTGPGFRIFITIPKE